MKAIITRRDDRVTVTSRDGKILYDAILQGRGYNKDEQWGQIWRDLSQYMCLDRYQDAEWERTFDEWGWYDPVDDARVDCPRYNYRWGRVETRPTIVVDKLRDQKITEIELIDEGGYEED